MKGTGGTGARLIAGSVLLAAVIFALDLSLPLGVAGGVPYVALVLISLRSPQRGYTLIVATGSTLLTALGFFFSSPGGALWMVLANRLLALFAIWVTAVLSLQRKRAEEALREAHEKLERRVKERTAELSRANETLKAQITERKRVERTLHESEAKYRSLVEQVPAITYTAAPDDAGSTLYVSPQIESVLGFSVAEWTTESPDLWSRQLHPEDRERVLAERAESYAKGEPFITEYRVLSREGRVLWFSNHAEFVRDETGKPLFLQGIMIDQTNRKEAEEQIRRYNEELEKQVKQRTEEVRELERQRAETEKLAATGRLAAGIAHEINNPLAGIKNAFQLIQDAVPETHPHHHYVGRIEKEINRIANIVRQMYNLYKPEPGTLREVDLNLVVRDIVALLEPKGRQRDVLLTVETPALPIRAFLPEGSLAQVLYNLLMNAIEASPAGDEVKVSTALAGAGRARIRVSDRGPGIPEDLRSRVFEPFFTTKSDPSEAGLGLGLSISRSLVEAMGGALDFESEPGRGTVFRTDLPLRARTIEPERPETEKEASPL